MGQGGSVAPGASSASHAHRSQCLCSLMTNRTSDQLQGLDLSDFDNRIALNSEKERACWGSKSSQCLPGPSAIRQASRHAFARMCRFRKFGSFGSGDEAASSPMPLRPINSEVAFRRREAYLHRLGIPRHTPIFDKRRRGSSFRTPRSSPRKTSECLELTFDDTAHGMSCTMSMSSQPSSEYGSAHSFPQSSSTFVSDSGSFETVGSFQLTGQTSRDSQARLKFLQKLSYKRVWLPKVQRPPSHQTVIIFDWDDTLLCTSYLLRLQEAGPLPLAVKSVLKEMDKVVVTLVSLAVCLGQTFIITNAVSGWVEHTAAKHLPSLVPVLHRVHLISARSRYEASFPNEIAKWKAEAFLEVQRQLDSQVITNLVSLGDSRFEMEATLAMGRQFEQARIKTVKFHSFPSPEELLKQQELVCKEFERIVGNPRDLRVSMGAPQNRSDAWRKVVSQ